MVEPDLITWLQVRGGSNPAVLRQGNAPDACELAVQTRQKLPFVRRQAACILLQADLGEHGVLKVPVATASRTRHQNPHCAPLVSWFSGFVLCVAGVPSSWRVSLTRYPGPETQPWPAQATWCRVCSQPIPGAHTGPASHRRAQHRAVIGEHEPSLLRLGNTVQPLPDVIVGMHQQPNLRNRVMASAQVNSSGTIRIGSHALLSRGSAAFICRSSSRCYHLASARRGRTDLPRGGRRSRPTLRLPRGPAEVYACGRTAICPRAHAGGPVWVTQSINVRIALLNDFMRGPAGH